MFTPAERERLRAELVEAARADPRLSGVAMTGSGAGGRLDDWSDIDLAFGVRSGVDLAATLGDWSADMYSRHGVLHHLDVVAGNWVYRVFLLPSTLQVDLAFAPEAEFGARAPTFKLLHGQAVELPAASPPSMEGLIGLAWLYALHVRSSLARGRRWQAEYMIGKVRDHVVALACVRNGLPWSEGRGVDRLPPETLSALEETLVGSLDPDQMARSFRAAVAILLEETCAVDAALGERLRPALRELSQGGER